MALFGFTNAVHYRRHHRLSPLDIVKPAAQNFDSDLIQLSVSGDQIKAARPCLLRTFFFSFRCLLTLKSGLRNKTELVTELEVFHDRDAAVNVRFFPFRTLSLIEKGLKSEKHAVPFFFSPD